jgi:Ca-activated chloride channel family protein
MGLLTPINLGLAALAVPIIILYMLRLRRREVLVSSTFLWQMVVRDREANAPWQRLKRNLLLFLQLLILAALVLALARPWAPAPTVAQGNLVVLLDGSASMAATDVSPTRFDAALAVVRGLIDNLGIQDRLTLVLAGPQPRVLISQSGDKAALSAALGDARVAQGPADWSAAFALAIAQARSTQSPTVVIVSDGGMPAGLPPLPGEARFVRVGRSGDNLALAALAARSVAGGVELFVAVTNASEQDADTVVAITLDGQLHDAINLHVPARGRAERVLTLPAGARVIQARLPAGDALALDDQATAVAPASGGGRVLLVTAGNLFLEKALALLPGVSSFRADPAKPLPPGNFDVTLLDGVISGTLPAGDLLLIAPPRSTELFDVTGVFSNTRITRVAEHPLLQYVDTTSLHVLRARAIAAPDWAQTVIEAEGGPLLLAGETGGRRIAILTFDLHDSDLPLQVAFPILLTNLFQWYAPARLFDAPAGLAPGQPLAIQAPPDATAVTVTRPDGTAWQGSPGGATTYAETDQLGLYTVVAQTPGGEVRQSFAVNLFAPGESNIRPSDTIVLGTQPVSAAPPETPGQREIWPWIAALGLAVLTVEWWVYHRGATLPVIRRPGLERA